MDHPEQPAGHNGCLAGSVACRDPKCPPVTHIPCLSCKRPIAVVSFQSAAVTSFECPSCQHEWHWPGALTTH